MDFKKSFRSALLQLEPINQHHFFDSGTDNDIIMISAP